MAEQHLLVEGWWVSSIEADLMFSEHRVDLQLYRTTATWSLLQVRHRTEYSRDGSGQPVGGSARVGVETFDSIEALRAEVTRQFRSAGWRELVRAGAGNPFHDPDLTALWAPVQVDIELDKASVYLRDLTTGGEGHQTPPREMALACAERRLEELGFVVFNATTTATKVFPRRLVEQWGNPVLGAITAARQGRMFRLLTAVDSAGEIYTRTGDPGAEPGETRRFPPRELTEAEWAVVEEAGRQRRAEARRRQEGSGRG